MERFAADPTASIPEPCDGWGETIAAYRFLGNESVDWRDILAPHRQQTQLRMQSEPVVLCLQDTSELNFNGQEIEGLGPLSYDSHPQPSGVLLVRTGSASRLLAPPSERYFQQQLVCHPRRLLLQYHLPTQSYTPAKCRSQQR